MTDDRALQGDDGPAGGQRIGDLGVDVHELHPTSPDAALRFLRPLDHLIGRVEH